jgi:hypothetical protein
MGTLRLGQIPEGVLTEIQTWFEIAMIDLNGPVSKKTKTYKLRYQEPIDDKYAETFIVRVDHVGTNKKQVHVKRIETTGRVRIKK